MERQVLKIKVKKQIVMDANELHMTIRNYIDNNYDELYSNGGLNKAYDIEICLNPSEHINIRQATIEEERDTIYRMVAKELGFNPNYRKPNTITFDGDKVVFVAYNTMKK